MLEDHYTGEEINAAVGERAEFGAAFPGETEGEARRAARAVPAQGAGGTRGRLLATVDDPASRDPRPSADPTRIVAEALRRALGMDAGASAPAFVKGDGTPLAAGEVDRFRRLAGLTAVSLETNGGMCRDLLRIRYGREVAA